MESSLDTTTLATLSLLEARLARIEHILYGPSQAPDEHHGKSAVYSLAELEHRLHELLQRYRVYTEILKICMYCNLWFSLSWGNLRCFADNAHPSLFHSTSADSAPPIDLSPEAVRATVLSYASSFPAIASALTSVTTDTPVPDTKLSTELASLMPRMKGVEATQLAQEADIAELRARSERVIRAWYEGNVLRYGQAVTDAETRFEKVEMAIRRQEKLRKEETAI